jgi:hypothetical protein
MTISDESIVEDLKLKKDVIGVRAEAGDIDCVTKDQPHHYSIQVC